MEPRTERLLRFDLHIHSHASQDSRMTPLDIVRTALARGLDGIAVTDHNTFSGTDALARAADGRLILIPGAEYATDHGHLLVYFLRSNLAEGLTPDIYGRYPLAALAARAHAQGALLFAAHPLLKRKDADPVMLAAADGYEVCNGRAMGRALRDAVRLSNAAAADGKLRCAGSDAHIPAEIGRCCTLLSGDPYTALQSGAVRCFGRATPRIYAAVSHWKNRRSGSALAAFPLRLVKNAGEDLLRLPSRLRGGREY